MIRVGLVGIGFMGMIHYLAYQRVRGMRVDALVSRNPKKRKGDWRGIQGNFGPPGTQMDLSGVTCHGSLEAMLQDPKIDLVDICLPPSLHAPAAVAALQAGKHVFCEKPMAVSARDAQKMIQAARKAKRHLFIGHVLPFFPEYAFVRKTIDSGKYGKPWGGHFKRVISEPLWIPNFFNAEAIGGPLIDLHIHDAHFIRVLFGMPRRIMSQGRLRKGIVEYASSQFMYDQPDRAVTAVSGVIRQQGRSFTHAFEIYLEKATLTYDFSVFDGEPVLGTPLTLLTDKGRVVHPKVPAGDPLDAFVAEIQEVKKSLNEDRASPLLDGQLAQDALGMCHLQARSAAQGKMVRCGGA